jgi:capsid protein
VRARLEGAMAKRRLRGWNPPLENINALVASGGPRLLARSRELVVTNGYAANACEAFAANLVGDGIKPSSLIGTRASATGCSGSGSPGPTRRMRTV